MAKADQAACEMGLLIIAAYYRAYPDAVSLQNDTTNAFNSVSGKYLLHYASRLRGRQYLSKYFGTDRKVIYKSDASPGVKYEVKNASISQGDRTGGKCFEAVQGAVLRAVMAVACLPPMRRFHPLLVAVSDNIVILARSLDVILAMCRLMRSGDNEGDFERWGVTADDFTRVKADYGGVFPSLERRGLIAGKGLKSSLVVVQSHGEPLPTQQQRERLRELSLILGYFHEEDSADGNVYNFLGVPALGSKAAKAAAVEKMANSMIGKFDEVAHAVHTEANSGIEATIKNPRATLHWVMRYTLPAALMHVARNCDPEFTRCVFEAFDGKVQERFVENTRLADTAWLGAYRARYGELAVPPSLSAQLNLSLRQAGFAVTSLSKTCDSAFIGAAAKSMNSSKHLLEASSPGDNDEGWHAILHKGPTRVHSGESGESGRSSRTTTKPWST